MSEPFDDPCWSRCFLFPFSNIAESISEAIQKKISSGQLVIETPQDFAALTIYEPPRGHLVPMKMTIDLRDPFLKQENLKGEPQTTFRKNIGLYNIQQRIISCFDMDMPTAPSLHHNANFKLIFNLHIDTEETEETEEDSKTQLKIYSDQKPYEMIQEIKIDFPAYYATSAIDRRSCSQQTQNKLAIFGLIAHDDSNKLVLVKIDEKG